jgi:cytochrome c biogenesis protein CcmG/thiol:disulfide interchange protein DsbE
MTDCVLTKPIIAVLLFCVVNIAWAGDKAPDFQLPAINGDKVQLSDFKGHVVYVDFWATWCPPCRKSFPWMQAMHQRYQDLGLKILAISLDQKTDLIKSFVKAQKADFTVLQDKTGQVAEAYKVKGMPSSYLVDRKGIIRLKHAGFNDGDKAALEAQMKQLLAE